LQASSKIGSLTQRQLFLPGATSHVADHHQPGMDAEAYGQVHPPLLPQVSIELAQSLDDS
jgi:hypothetical protein